MTFMPPLVIDARVRKSGSNGYRVWLPFVLLWPILLIVVGFALLVSIIVDSALLLAGARYHHFTLLVVRCLQLLSEVRGTTAHVRRSDSTLVDVDIY